MASRFTIYSTNQISDLIYQISNIMCKISEKYISDILYKFSFLLFIELPRRKLVRPELSDLPTLVPRFIQ